MGDWQQVGDVAARVLEEVWRRRLIDECAAINARTDIGPGEKLQLICAATIGGAR